MDKATGDDGYRANHDGDPCPSWCDTDHDRKLVKGKPWTDDAHRSPIAYVQGGKHYANVYARKLNIQGYESQVTVETGIGRIAALYIGPEDSAWLASLIDYLSDASPSMHKALAVKIRETAAIITGDPLPEA